MKLSSLSPIGKFTPSKWWGRLVLWVYTLRGKKVSTRSAPAVTKRWIPPEHKQHLVPISRRDTRRLARIGRQARRVRAGSGRSA